MDLNELTSHYNLHQLINTPTHILPNSESCIDLIFTSQPNLISESGVHASLFPRCHHQIIYAKVNLKVYYPPSKAELTKIKKSLSQINWHNALKDLNVNDQVEYLTSCILNVFSNFVPNKTITCREKDPPWMTDEVKIICHMKAKIYEKYIKNGRSDVDKDELVRVTSLSSDVITKAKEKYLYSLGNKLNDPQTGAKSYWSILNKFLHKKKIPLIPPMLCNGIFVTNIYEKITLFNTFFADQCTPINNSSTLPPFEYKINSNIENISFSEHEIVSIIRSLNSSKAHGWDGISIRMIKMCDESISPPLKIIFDTALKSGIYPDKWKRANVVPVHKKESKNILKNYKPISLLPICGKIFEKCIYNSLYSYLESNNILSKSQSGFRKGDSCISQLLAITHEIYSNFDAYPSLETRGVFLDISKAFDKVWHEGLLYKLKSYGISGPLLILIKSFLANRFQRVVLNGQSSCWKEILAGVPQGSILGPLLFLIFINDIPEGIQSNIKIFADDTSIFSVMKNSISASATLNEDLLLISKWAYSWKMSFNPDPSKQATEIVFSKKQSNIQLPALIFNNNILKPSDSHKHLGLILDKKLNFKNHLSEKISKANKGLGVIKRLYKFLPRASLVNIYRAFVRPNLDYGDIIYNNSSNATFSQMIESVQYNAALAITGAIRGTSREKLYQELGFESLHDRRWFRKLCFYYKIRHNMCPLYLTELLPIMKTHCHSLRTNRPPIVPNFRTERFKSTFFPSCSFNWNQLGTNIQNSSSLEIFKRALLTFIRPKPAEVYKIHHPKGLKLLTRLRLGLSHLREHKFRHNFNDTIDPFCLCGTNSFETSEHYFLHCPTYAHLRLKLFDNLRNNNILLLPLVKSNIIQILLYGSNNYIPSINKLILSVVIDFIIQSKRFNDPLIQ